MGHDIHFLKRLERVSLPQVELAMSLYNDSPLVEFILHKARLPESAASVAISLGDPEQGPFVILTRAGRFVTCLGEGMRVDPGTPVITRQHLDAMTEKAEDFRARIEQARKVAGNKGRVYQLLRRIHTAADDLSREEFIGLSAWRPLLRREFFSQLMEAVEYLERARKVLRKLDKPPKQYEEPLREYWNIFWAVGHLSLLLGEEIRELMEQSPSVMAHLHQGGSTLSWGMVRQGFLPLALRAAWLASKLGRSGVALYKNAFERSKSLFQLTDSALGLVALAARHGSQRGEIRKALMREFPQGTTPKELTMRGIVAAARIATLIHSEEPEKYQEIVQDLGQRIYLSITNQLPEEEESESEVRELTPDQRASVRDELILPTLSWHPIWFLKDMEMTQHMFLLVPYAARAQAEDFYFAQEDLARLRRPWQPEDSLGLLRSYRDRYAGAAKPARAKETPGRNDPCPCSSGKKYKRCCALSDPPPPS